MDQSLTISTHYEYTIRNQANYRVRFEAYKWKLRKTVPKSLAGMPGSAGTPRNYGNIINLLGRAAYSSDHFTANLGNNEALLRAEFEVSDCPMFSEYVKWSKVSFSLPPGGTRVFKIGARQKQFWSYDLFEGSGEFAPNVGASWTKPFTDHSRGYFFRMFSEAAESTTGPSTVGDFYNGTIRYTSPQCLLNTKYTYHVWPGTQNVHKREWYVASGAVSSGSAPTLVDPTSGLPTVETNA